MEIRSIIIVIVERGQAIVKTVIEKWGDSLAVRIPDRFVIQLKSPENPTLAEFADRIFPENLHKELDL